MSKLVKQTFCQQNNLNQIWDEIVGAFAGDSDVDPSRSPSSDYYGSATHDSRATGAQDFDFQFRRLEKQNLVM